MPDAYKPAPTQIRTVAIISKPRVERAAEMVPGLVRWLTERHINVHMDEQTALYAGSKEGFPRDAVPEGADLVIVLGGDGTLLAAARAVGPRDIPLLAVNLGNLGFLTAITVEELYPQLERVLRGEYQMSRRAKLRVEHLREGRVLESYEALNDACIAKSEIARIIDLEAHVDGHRMSVYKGDGLIISTPTGSTAYSLSAGGPIVFPTVAGHCITPICPHMLTQRSVIVPDDKVIKIVLRSGNTTYLTVDGQAGSLLMEGDEVVCRRSEQSIRLIRQEGQSFFDVLREKLTWGG